MHDFGNPKIEWSWKHSFTNIILGRNVSRVLRLTRSSEDIAVDQYYRPPRQWPWLVLTLAACGVSEVFISEFGTFSSFILETFATGNTNAVIELLVHICWRIGVIAFALALRKYSIGHLAIIWRMSLLKTVADSFLVKLTIASSALSDVDQRIATDVQGFSSIAAALIDQIIFVPILVSFYALKTAQLLGWQALPIVFAFWLIGMAFQQFFMRKYRRAQATLDESEGHLRSTLSYMCEHAESIALSEFKYGFEGEVAARAQAIRPKSHLSIRLGAILSLLGGIFSYFGGILNYFLILLHQYLNGQREHTSAIELAKLLSLSSFYTMSLIYRLTQIIEKASEIATLQAYASRIVELLDVLDRMISKAHLLRITSAIPKEIHIQNVTIITPAKHVLLRHLSLYIRHGEHVYIDGPNGSGKTSIARVLMGLWSSPSGQVKIFGSISCLPQSPVLHTGSLVDQLQLKENETINEIAPTIFSIGLGHLLDKLGSIDQSYTRFEWRALLSPGELQRLAIGRVLLNSPDFVILDEATSSLDEVSEFTLYQLLWGKNITTVTIGHGLSRSMALHTRHHLTLLGDGTYTYHSFR